MSPANPACFMPKSFQDLPPRHGKIANILNKVVGISRSAKCQNWLALLEVLGFPRAQRSHILQVEHAGRRRHQRASKRRHGGRSRWTVAVMDGQRAADHMLTTPPDSEAAYWWLATPIPAQTSFSGCSAAVPDVKLFVKRISIPSMPSIQHFFARCGCGTL